MNATAPPDDAPLIERLRWCAEEHVTREYRTITIGEHEAKLLVGTLENVRELIDWVGRFQVKFRALRALLPDPADKEGRS